MTKKNKEEMVYILYRFTGKSDPEVVKIFSDWEDAKEAKKQLKKEIDITERVAIVEYPLA
jgi:hypothetical protein